MYLLLKDLIEAEDPDGMDNEVHEKAKELSMLIRDDFANGIVTTRVIFDEQNSKFIVEKVNIFKKDESLKK